MNLPPASPADDTRASISFQSASVPFTPVLRFLLWKEQRGVALGAAATFTLAVLLNTLGVEVWIVWVGALAVAIVVLTAAVMIWQARRRFRQQRALFGTSEVELTVAASGVSARTVLGEAFVKWNGVKEVLRRPTFWLIHFAANEDLTIVPAAAISPEFRAVFERHAQAAGVRLLDA